MKMFDWFKKRDYNNVIKFPKPESVPYVEPPVPEEPATIFYRIGTTDKNRISFQMGYSEITLNKEGVQHMIAQLSVFRDQLTEENE
jgi:hypothetical protein